MPVSAVIRCHEDERIIQCIDDLRKSSGNHEIVAVLTETSQQIRKLLDSTDITVATAPVGNLSLSSNIGIETSKHDRVVILDTDIRCSERYLDVVDQSLDNHELVKTAVEYEYKTFPERLVAEYRDYIHSLDVFYCPGIAFHKSLKDKIGGQYFNDDVWWSEDAEMNFRIKVANIPIYDEEAAILTHTPVDMTYDLKGAFKIGRGKYSQVQYANRKTFEENVSNVLKRIGTGKSLADFVRLAHEKSVPTACYSVIWQAAYLLGYHSERMKTKSEKK